jgi:hypothetical protein
MGMRTVPISLSIRHRRITMDINKPGDIWVGMSNVVHRPIDTKNHIHIPDHKINKMISLKAIIGVNDT